MMGGSVGAGPTSGQATKVVALTNIFLYTFFKLVLGLDGLADHQQGAADKQPEFAVGDVRHLHSLSCGIILLGLG